ncbi:hypothetical protein MAR_022955 [Mya arenaria]|uniref:Uncharacterized protein n=1 Tax=Mya arenaria TaxID=6604 RepID=A0ABY7DPF0_MYAAR|nr:hypothetical protein MAR_022955 [Mya arenaria]
MTGFYGFECHNTCSGNCRYNTTCNFITGPALTARTVFIAPPNAATVGILVYVKNKLEFVQQVDVSGDSKEPNVTQVFLLFNNIVACFYIELEY